MLLLFKLNALLEEPHKRQFWAAILCKDKVQANTMFSSFCAQLIPRCELLPDARSRELLGRAFTWGRDNPGSFYLHPRSRFIRQGRSPNIIGFLNILEGLQAQSDAWSRPLTRRTHDRTIEFEQSLSEWHELLSNASAGPALIAWGEPPRNIRMVPGSCFVISPSADSPGIQAIDIVLWLVRRHFNGDSLSAGCADFMRFIANRATIKDLRLRAWSTSFRA